VHPSVSVALSRGVVLGWAEVLCHLSRDRFGQICDELTG